ncbi:MAG: hydantoinase/oxoprolinase family protein [Hyphomicrobium sp.]|jgi:probable H4MPT-linked C1 transfer pathway protein
MPVTAGYDVGGAHLKVALAENGRTIAVRQIACPLWQGIDRLDVAFAQAAELTARADTHAATMTGELCELFPDRRAGVEALLDRLQAILGEDVRIWMGRLGFGDVDAARRAPMHVASTNFLATATLVATRLPNALLIDMGSTTTDIIAIRDGAPAPRGLTDGERLVTGELVYTGLTRTDVSVVAQRGTLNGQTQRLAAGGFANMADVRRVLGELTDAVDQHAAFDNRGKSASESVARFARCFGRDATDASIDEWRAAARMIADQQAREIRGAIDEALAAVPLPAGAPIVGAGIGAGEIARIASALARDCLPFGILAEAVADCSDWATRCAPATALALLANTD